MKFIDQCGGDLMVAHNLLLHQQTVKRWAKRGGIPRKYWWRLAELSGLPIEAIEDLHQQAKNQ